jgi:hypothetical protein
MHRLEQAHYLRGLAHEHRGIREQGRLDFLCLGGFCEFRGEMVTEVALARPRMVAQRASWAVYQGESSLDENRAIQGGEEIGISFEPCEARDQCVRFGFREVRKVLGRFRQCP